MDDTLSVVEIMEGLAHDMQVASDEQDHASLDRVYTRFLSKVEPGVTNANVFPLTLDHIKNFVFSHHQIDQS